MHEIFLQQVITHMVFLCTCTFCMQLPFDPHSISVVLSFWTVDDACHTNEMVIYHKASRSIICVDLITPLSRSERHSRADAEWFCSTILSKISVSPFSFSSDLSASIVAVPTVLVHKVTYKAWSTFNFCGWLHPRKLNMMNFLHMKYF